MYLSSFSLVLSLKKKTGKADQVKKFGLEGKELGILSLLLLWSISDYLLDFKQNSSMTTQGYATTTNSLVLTMYATTQLVIQLFLNQM